MTRAGIFACLTALAACLASSTFVRPAQSQTVMQQCGQQFQAAKAAGTLNGMTWNQFRTDCATKLKAQPAAAPMVAPAPAAAAPAAPAAAPIIANPLKPVAPAPAPAAIVAPVAPAAPSVTTAAAPRTTAPLTGGRAAFVTRERQCGAEWRAQKVSLVARTPGLTWPKYLSLCNARLKGAGQ